MSRYHFLFLYILVHYPLASISQGVDIGIEYQQARVKLEFLEINPVTLIEGPASFDAQSGYSTQLLLLFSKSFNRNFSLQSGLAWRGYFGSYVIRENISSVAPIRVLSRDVQKHYLSIPLRADYKIPLPLKGLSFFQTIAYQLNISLGFEENYRLQDFSYAYVLNGRSIENEGMLEMREEVLADPAIASVFQGMLGMRQKLFSNVHLKAALTYTCRIGRKEELRLIYQLPQQATGTVHYRFPKQHLGYLIAMELSL